MSISSTGPDHKRIFAMQKMQTNTVTCWRKRFLLEHFCCICTTYLSEGCIVWFSIQSANKLRAGNFLTLLNRPTTNIFQSLKLQCILYHKLKTDFLPIPKKALHVLYPVRQYMVIRLTLCSSVRERNKI